MRNIIAERVLRPAARAAHGHERPVEGPAALMTARKLPTCCTRRPSGTSPPPSAGLLADRAAPADIIARTERPETYDAKLWRTVAAEIGIAGLLIPEALGGAGASYRELAAAAEQFGAFVAPDPVPGQRGGRDGGAAVGGAQCRRQAAAGDDTDAGAGRTARAASAPPRRAPRRPPAPPSCARPRARRTAARRRAPHTAVSPAAGLLRQLADGASRRRSSVTRRHRAGRAVPGRRPGHRPRRRGRARSS